MAGRETVAVYVKSPTLAKPARGVTALTAVRYSCSCKINERKLIDLYIYIERGGGERERWGGERGGEGYIVEIPDFSSIRK